MTTRVTPKTLQGMRDFLPDRMLLRQHVVTTLREVFESFGFEPVDTPALEYAETLEGKYGEEADNLIYKFEDRGGRMIGLRYDLTVPLARLVGQYPELPRPFKRYHMGPVWRAERPQKGRYREFWQCDVDVAGSTSMLADAEVVNVAYAALSRLGIPDFTVRINDRKILAALTAEVGLAPEESSGLTRAIDKLDRIGEAGVRQELAERGYANGIVDRVFALIEGGGGARDYLAELRGRFAAHPVGLEGVAELEQVVTYLEAAGVPARAYRVDLTMVRGLDYYTGPIFEAVVEKPRMGSICGGGRYDGLVGFFSSQPVPATGLTIGLDRIFDVIVELGLRPPTLGKTVTDVLVAVFPDTATESLAIASELRRAGLRVEVNLGAERLPTQLRYADRRGIGHVVIAGSNEVAAGQVVLKTLATGEQATLPRADLLPTLRAALARPA